MPSRDSNPRPLDCKSDTTDSATTPPEWLARRRLKLQCITMATFSNHHHHHHHWYRPVLWFCVPDFSRNLVSGQSVDWSVNIHISMVVSHRNTRPLMLTNIHNIAYCFTNSEIFTSATCGNSKIWITKYNRASSLAQRVTTKYIQGGTTSTTLLVRTIHTRTLSTMPFL